MSSVRVIAVSGCLQGAEGTVATGGVFSGTYRLERLVDQYGQTAAGGGYPGSQITADRAHQAVDHTATLVLPLPYRRLAVLDDHRAPFGKK